MSLQKLSESLNEAFKSDKQRKYVMANRGRTASKPRGRRGSARSPKGGISDELSAGLSDLDAGKHFSKRAAFLLSELGWTKSPGVQAGAWDLEVPSGSFKLEPNTSESKKEAPWLLSYDTSDPSKAFDGNELSGPQLAHIVNNMSQFEADLKKYSYEGVEHAWMSLFDSNKVGR